MKTFYHGTASTFLPDIRRAGLKTLLRNKWRVTASWTHRDLYELEKNLPFVWIARNQDIAEQYARMKADYLRCPTPGCRIPLAFDPSGDSYMIKQVARPYDATAKPVVLRVDLPDEWLTLRDPHSVNGCVSPLPIPPQYISMVSQEEVAA